MKDEPLNSKLPGKYGKMTRRDMDALVETLNRPISLRETRTMTPQEARQWRNARKPGRPRRGKGARVISLSVEQSLLAKADAAARRNGPSRAALFEMGVRSLLTRMTKKAG